MSTLCDQNDDNSGGRTMLTCGMAGRKEKKRKDKTTLFSINLMRSQVLYRAAQVNGM